MKLPIAAVVMLCIIMPLKAQLLASARLIDSSPAMERPFVYKVTYPPGFRMRNTGRTLTVAGGAMLIGGIVIFNNADKTIYTYQTSAGTYNESDPKAALGALMIVGGIGMTVPGVILWSKGSRKFKRYLERETAFVINTSGLSLQYRF